MKQNKWTRLASLLLALCLMLTLIPVTAQAEEEGTSETIDFVLVMDCSGTMKKNDPDQLAAEACKMFVDLIPVEDARVSIVTFGYSDGDPFAYSQFVATYDAGMVHSISKMEGKLGSDVKDEIKSALSVAADKNGPRSPIGAALAAGLEVLLSSGASDGNACIILMSDGDVSSANLEENSALLDSVPGIARQHDWPIYCIELDYEGRNESGVSTAEYDGKKARALLNRIVTESGAGEDGRMKVSDAAEVSEAFMKIFADLWGGDTDVSAVQFDETGVVERTFQIPKLVSEATIAISSDCVEYVHLVGPNFDKEFRDDLDSENLIVTEEDSYMCIKMICPASGDWTVSVYGDPNAEIIMYKGLQMEMNLDMTAVATSDATALTKNDFINVQARYTYNGNTVTGDDIYQTTVDSAKLIVTNANGMVTQFDMEATMDGYTCKLPVVNVPSGDFTLQVEVQHSMFRSGKASSNISGLFHSDNLPLTYNEGVNTDKTAYVNSSFETIDLAQVFQNPDGDPVEYTLSCTSDKNVAFAYDIDQETEYLNIETGMVPGTYVMEVTAADPDMTQPLTHTFTLVVEDRAIVCEEIPEQEVWVDYMHFLWIQQDPTNLELDVDLSQYFSDPDGVELTYSNIRAEADGDSEGAVNVELTGGNNNVAHVDPVEKGQVIVSWDVSDGVSTITAQMRVEVVSGVVIYWKTYGIVYAIVIAILIALAITAWVIVKNKRVKGTWDISFEEDDTAAIEAEGVDISAHTASGRRSKFYLHELVSDLTPFLGEEGSSVLKYFDGTGADKIQLGGVYSKKGCVIVKLPKASEIPQDVEIRVSHGGLPVTKKKVVKTGRIIFEIEQKSEEKKLTIQMNLK